MKRFVPTVLILAATPLFAADPPKKEQPAPQPAVIIDSPLVAAAKKTPKPKKTTIVITNETLSKSGSSNAHITTTSKVIGGELPAPPPAPATVVPADPNLRVVQTPKASPEEAKKRLAEAAARAEEDGPYSDDPARAERQLETLAKAAKQTETKPEKP
jgi:hypothetical protein